MDKHTFSRLLESRFDKMIQTLDSKSQECSSDQDKLQNFNVSCQFTVKECSPEQALLGMMRKHIFSVIELAECAHERVFSEAHIDEKIGDLINYAVLLEALLKERYGYVKLPLPGPLPSENNEQSKPFELEYGKKYRARNGGIFGPLTKTPEWKVFSIQSPFSCHQYRWSKNGKYMAGDKPNVLDLIEEVK